MALPLSARKITFDVYQIVIFKNFSAMLYMIDSRIASNSHHLHNIKLLLMTLRTMFK